MMRSRNIKPGFFKNEELVQLAESTRLLFIGLWCLADRMGRLEDRPVRIQMEVYPADKHDVSAMLDQLQDHGFILRYKANDICYIQITNFDKHQNPHKHEQESKIPPPNTPPKKKHGPPMAVHGTTKALTRPADSLIPDSLIPDSLIPGSPPKAGPQKHFVPPTPEQAREYALSLGFELDGEKFCAHYGATDWVRSGKVKVTNWKQCVLTWKPTQTKKPAGVI